MLYYFLFVLLGRVFFCEFGPWDFSNVYICPVTNLKYELKVVGCFRFFSVLGQFYLHGLAMLFANLSTDSDYKY